MIAKLCRITLLVFIMSLLVSGCGSGQLFGPTCTSTPTITPTPTSTLTPTPTSTSTTTPTPFPESSFSVSVIGYGEHGAMLELTYQGKMTDIGSKARAIISQGGQRKDSSYFEVTDGSLLAEMTDAKYQIGVIEVSLLLENGDQSQTIQKSAEYTQTYPFIYPIFHKADIGNSTLHDQNHTKHPQIPMYAHDLWVGKGIEGIPEHMPFSLQLMRIVNHKDYCHDKFGGNYNIWIRHPYTGYVCVLQHTQPGELLREIAGSNKINNYGWGYKINAPIIEYNPTRILASIGPLDGCSGMPHLHIECQNPYLHPTSVETYFGYDNEQYRGGLCDKGSPPCENISNIELLDFLLSGWVDNEK